MIGRNISRAQASLAMLLLALSASASAWWQTDWAYRKEIVVDATPAGAAAGTTLANVPVLVRLHEGVFRFADAKPDGSDLRVVSADDKTPLKFRIERYDAVFAMAQVWVQVPEVAAGKPVHLWLYYGNPDAAMPADDRGAAFDTVQLVSYPFGEKGVPAKDATANKLDATTAVPAIDNGLIAGSARFDGRSIVTLPASPKLAFLPTNALTVSLWVRPALAAQKAMLYVQRDEGGGEFLVGLENGVPYVAVSANGGPRVKSSPAPAIADTGWHHLAAVAEEEHVRLFVDGKEASYLAHALPALSGAATLGGDVTDGAVSAGFAGDIDEFGIANIARPPAWIALQAMNQGAADKVVAFGADEEQSGFGSGYAGVILQSVTIDGWIVIGLLLVMMVISWIIMAAKGVQVARVGAANELFLAAFRETSGDLARLHRALAPGMKEDLGIDDALRARIARSPLAKLFDEGLRELSQRLGRGGTLSGQTIEAIRASLNAVYVRELQSLNKRMVLLTIAISGGPFLGLLGTVVGVMITFAAVAATGDVNVNSIAPGISAALAATVAGLFVAIPALFGYNYLISRTKECGIEMQVFIDVFVTRIAEGHDDPAALHALAD